MFKIITDKLPQIEQTQQVKLLYVVESGSRAWGFSSLNSDYDVRGIFLRPYHNYLTINEPKDSFDWIENEWFDVGAWDIKKALRLLYKSNSVLLEWLQSPIVYQAYPNIQQQLLELAQNYYQPKVALGHYRGVAKTTNIITTNGQIRLKKWFYVLRSLLAAYWTIKEPTIPPMTLDNLLVTLPTSIQQEIKQLVIFKQDKDEAYVWTPSKTLQELIDWLWQVTDIQLPNYQPKNIEPLNSWFRELLDDVNYC